MRRDFALVVMLTAMLAACGSPSFRGSVVQEPLSVPDFALTDENGETFRLSDQRGNVVLLFFGYTSCPDVCPTTLANWRKVHETLGQDAARVRFVFVTVDPERDTVERLGLHVNAFNPDFVGLTGTQEELEAVYQVFDVFYEKDTSSASALGYLVNHTATTFVLDAEGVWRLRETYGTPYEDIVHDIRQLLG
ncbi:MAG: SCO family protein [Anaerolineae bacterium]|nr:SCO family protein [Anaerolineae bacterium]